MDNAYDDANNKDVHCILFFHIVLHWWIISSAPLLISN